MITKIEHDRWDWIVSVEKRGLTLSTHVSGGVLSAQTAEAALWRKLATITPRETITDNGHTLDAATGEYLDGPAGTGAPYTIAGRKPYKLTFRFEGQRGGGPHMRRWLESEADARRVAEDEAAARSSCHGRWTPKAVELVSFAEFAK
jgi:hypothetical protein